jgi:hypothetical protein
MTPQRHLLQPVTPRGVNGGLLKQGVHGLQILHASGVQLALGDNQSIHRPATQANANKISGLKP